MKTYKLTDIITPYIYSKNYQINMYMCSIPHEEILPQNIFTMPSFCNLYLQMFLCCSSVKSKLTSNFCPFYTNQYLPNVYNRQGLNTQ